MNIEGHDKMQMFSIVVDPKPVYVLLSLRDETELQKEMLAGIRKAFELDLPAVRVYCVDPAEEDGKLVFGFGNKPAVDHNYPWWKQKAEEHNRDKHSRLCTDLYWYIIQGMQVLNLIEQENYTAEAALYAVCDGNRDLTVEKLKMDVSRELQLTGDEKVGLFWDLLNTFKILESWDGSKLLLAGGHCAFAMRKYPLAYVKRIFNKERTFSRAVGLIMEDV